MSFTGHEDHSISLQDAITMTTNYRNANRDAVKAHFFGKDALQAILDQAGCVGIRIYYALDDQGTKHLVLCGADADENDLYDGQLAERSYPCPPYCGASSPLSE